MTAPAPGPAGAYLAKVAASDTAGIKGHPWIDDVPRLVAALEAALSFHRPVPPGRFGNKQAICLTEGSKWPCVEYQYIEAALTGAQGGPS